MSPRRVFAAGAVLLVAAALVVPANVIAIGVVYLAADGEAAWQEMIATLLADPAQDDPPVEAVSA